jgi:hypothetical protein
MKLGQNDWIIIGVAGVLALGTAIALYFTKPEPQAIPAPTPVDLGAAQLPATGVVMANSLPGGGNQGGRGGAMGGRGGALGGMGANTPGRMGGPGGGAPGVPTAGSMGRPGGGGRGAAAGPQTL